MAKVRLYMQVPEYKMPGTCLMAVTTPATVPIPGWKRVAFDVDLPPEVWKEADAFGLPAVGHVIDDEASE